MLFALYPHPGLVKFAEYIPHFLVRATSARKARERVLAAYPKHPIALMNELTQVAELGFLRALRPCNAEHEIELGTGPGGPAVTVMKAAAELLGRPEPSQQPAGEQMVSQPEKPAPLEGPSVSGAPRLVQPLYFCDQNHTDIEIRVLASTLRAGVNPDVWLDPTRSSFEVVALSGKAEVLSRAENLTPAIAQRPRDDHLVFCWGQVRDRWPNLGA